jgi:hypothetical protein
MKMLIRSAVLAAVVATACGAAVPTLIRRGEVGPVKAKMTHQNLEKLGEVTDNTFNIGDGTRPCSDLWMNDATRHIRVLWNSNKRAEIALVTGQATVYHTADGITLGTTLRQLEKLNGKPFKMSGFGWDYGGRITDWDGGKLVRLKGISFVLEFEPLRWTGLPDQGQSISGDRSLLSSTPELHRLDPHVSRIEVDLTQR